MGLRCRPTCLHLRCPRSAARPIVGRLPEGAPRASGHRAARAAPLESGGLPQAPPRHICQCRATTNLSADTLASHRRAAPPARYWALVVVRRRPAIEGGTPPGGPHEGVGVGCGRTQSNRAAAHVWLRQVPALRHVCKNGGYTLPRTHTHTQHRMCAARHARPQHRLAHAHSLSLSHTPPQTHDAGAARPPCHL